MTVLLIDADSLAYRIAANPNVKTLQGQQQILDETVEIIADKTKATDAVFLLTGKDNFRKDIPVPKLHKDGSFEVVQYKGNRKGVVPPDTLSDLRKYLQETYTDTMVFDIIEADDAISYSMYNLVNHWQVAKVIIVAIDKDLMQIPGKHFNWVKNEFTDQTFNDAQFFLKQQLLQGDPTDNVPGLPGIGTQKALKILTENPKIDIYDVYLRYYKTIQQPALWYTRTRSLIELLTPENRELLLMPYLSKDEYDKVLRDLHALFNLLMKKIQVIGSTPRGQDPMSSME